MKLIAPNHIELSRRNLVALLFALDSGEIEPTLSTWGGPDGFVQVRAVANAEHYGDRTPGWMPAGALEVPSEQA
jgi:hypothetical protein